MSGKTGVAIALALLALGAGALRDTLRAAEGGAMPAVYFPSSPSMQQLPVADRVVVHKGARRLELLRGNDVLRSYKVALGLMPVGPKERAGDFRTPEGSYRLTRRNPRSDYFMSIQISYPGPEDLKAAKANHWDPGGAIMIHGLPNVLKRDVSYYETRDWTDGCIAVSDSDMVEIWMLTQNNIPIDILP